MRSEGALASIPDPMTGLAVVVRGEVAELYLRSREAAHAPCEHPEKELRVRLDSASRPQHFFQCLICGSSVGTAVRKEAGALPPPWDPDLHEKWTSARDDRYRALQAEFLRRWQSLVDSQRLGDALSAEKWRREYEQYRRTLTWQRIRAKVMKRTGGVCEGCLDVPAQVVHHLTYQNIGQELLYELRALCHGCHDRAHPEHQDSFYDFDWDPCDGCRWGTDGHCSTYERPTYIALDDPAACGPQRVGFEPLK